MESKIVTLKINSDFGSTEQDLKNFGLSLKELDKEATNLDATFEEIYGDLKPLTARMGEAEDRLYELAKAGKQGSQEYKDLLKSVGEYKRVQQQTDLVVDAAAQTMGSKLTGSLNAAAGGFSLAQGSMALFGSESSSVEAAMLKVQSAMAISQGFETINQSTNSIKQLGLTLKNTAVVQGVMTAATAAYTFVTQASTTGLKLFRGALLGTGVGAIIVGLGLLIANFDKVKNAVMNLIPGLASVGRSLGGIVDSITDFVGATSDTSRALDKLKKDADNTLSVNKKFMQEHGDQVDEYTKKKIDAQNAYAEAVKEDGANQNALAKRLNRELAAIEYSRGDEKRKILEDAKVKAAAERKANNEKLIEEKKEEDKRYAEETKNGLNELRQAEFDNTVQKSTEKRGLLDEQIALLEEGVDAVQEAETATTAVTAEQTAARIKLAELEKKGKLEAADAVANTLSGMADLLGKETAAGKAAAVASATINTFSSAQKAYDATVGIPYVGPVLAPINAGIAIMAGIKNVKSILAVKVPGGGGGSAPSGGATGGGASAPSFNVVGNTGANQLAQTLNKEQPPIKTYVVAGDVTTGQSLDRNIITNASLG
jgi:hypothetical protein